MSDLKRLADVDALACEAAGCACVACAERRRRHRYQEATVAGASQSRQPWTAYDELLLFELIATGTTRVEIAKQLGRTWAAVVLKLQRMHQASTIDLPLQQWAEHMLESNQVG